MGFAKLTLIGGFGMLLASPTYGQWTYNPGFMTSYMAPVIINPCPNGKCSSSGDGRTSTQPVIARTTTTYTPSAARTRANLAAFANKTRKTDPQTAAQMDELFASGDILGQIGQGIAPYGLSTSNVADAYAVYWINAWEASRGIVGSQETRQRAQAVKAQAARGLSSSPEFASATEAQKQEFAEAMLVQAAMISAHMEAAASDPAQLRAVGEAVLKGAKAAGLDLDTMELTPNGFAASKAKGRKRSDASGVDGGARAAGDTVLASADVPTKDEAPSNPLATYALIAAAGGAGLGGVYLLGKASAKKG